MFSVTPDDFAKVHFLGEDSVLVHVIEEIRKMVDEGMQKHLKHVQTTKQAVPCVYVNLSAVEAKHPDAIFNQAHSAVVAMLRTAGFEASQAVISGEDREQSIKITLPLAAK